MARGFSEAHFTLGIEEEYPLVDARTYELLEAPDALMAACAGRLADQVSPEFLQCQIEVGTGVCTTIAEARADLRRLRGTVAECAARFETAPIAVSCDRFCRLEGPEPHGPRPLSSIGARLGGGSSSGC